MTGAVAVAVTVTCNACLRRFLGDLPWKRLLELISKDTRVDLHHLLISRANESNFGIFISSLIHLSCIISVFCWRIVILFEAVIAIHYASTLRGQVALKLCECLLNRGICWAFLAWKLWALFYLPKTSWPVVQKDRVIGHLFSQAIFKCLLLKLFVFLSLVHKPFTTKLDDCRPRTFPWITQVGLCRASHLIWHSLESVFVLEYILSCWLQ